MTITNGVCDNCGNPEKMYWCEGCGTSGEEEFCDMCKQKMELDKDYHLDCNGFENNN